MKIIVQINVIRDANGSYLILPRTNGKKSCQPLLALGRSAKFYSAAVSTLLKMPIKITPPWSRATQFDARLLQADVDGQHQPPAAMIPDRI